MDEPIQNQEGNIPQAGDYPAPPNEAPAVAPTQEVIQKAVGSSISEPKRADASVLDAQKPIAEEVMFSPQSLEKNTPPVEQVKQTPMKESIKTSGKSPALMIGIIVLLIVAVFILMKFRPTAAPSLPGLDTSIQENVIPPADDSTQVINQQLEQIQIDDVTPEFQDIDQDLNTL
ncbi:MAG: hypothetical protein UU76_C0007G0026 [Parcubacteria group bacterium GW2011_GWC1_41_7]|nr:MAG: hypothetical protein UU76_C0007G0026 [Parcubacteria group bacterium GW2011_GWC1_41_7]